jgi:hypothetical protein
MMTPPHWTVAFCIFTGAASLFAVANQPQQASAQSAKEPVEKRTGYAPVNGLKMYYEIKSVGKPAVHIHPIVSHCGLIPGLTKNRRWIAMDLQDHGRTADIDRSLTCEQHADDIAAAAGQRRCLRVTPGLHERLHLLPGAGIHERVLLTGVHFVLIARPT